jgi:hypothetical protein
MSENIKLKIPKKKSEAVNHRMTDNAMTKEKGETVKH